MADYRHAVVWIGHDQAAVAEVSAENGRVTRMSIADAANAPPSRPLSSTFARRLDQFMGHVASAVGGSEQIVVAGTAATTSNFQHYVSEHHPLIAARIVGIASGEQPASEGQMLDYGRSYFHLANRLAD
ncbi:MAG: hypothetical protein JWN39_1386 [Ilumatobacteraceae bacterium]|nr:hypothetical protein [Ilumatobacteraceae bacterium]